jgi:hypothetical protein
MSGDTKIKSWYDGRGGKRKRQREIKEDVP